MKPTQLEWRIVGRDGEDRYDLAHHVVSRVSTALRTVCDRYDGARLHGAQVVFGLAHRSHLVTAVLGRESVGGDLALRLLISSNIGAKWAVAVFPLVLIASLITFGNYVGGPVGLLAGSTIGVVVGAAAAFGAYLLADRLSFGRTEDEGRSAGIGLAVARELGTALEPLGVRLVPARGPLTGLDDQRAQDDDAEWKASLQRALDGLTG